MIRKQLGNQGEQLAKRYLQKKKYKFLTANYRSRFGEIDLIFSYQDQIIFVEVKTRKTTTQGSPEEAVTPNKLSKIKKTAQDYLIKHDLTNKLARIDVIAIEYVDQRPQIRHIESVTS